MLLLYEIVFLSPKTHPTPHLSSLISYHRKYLLQLFLSPFRILDKMASATTILRLFALSAALGQATASFSLNTSGPSWDYTTKDLAKTTSQACKDAYSTSINCDETLVKIVASMDPDFDPQSSDLQAMCTTTCSDSLSQYIKDVTAACGKDGDLAGVASGNKYIYQAPVATVGEVFQYKYGQSCAKSG